MKKGPLHLSSRTIALLCVLALLVSLVPLYLLAMYNHPFYDDFGFSIRIHHVWNDTGSVAAAVKEAWQNMLNTRRTWQGNYTATFLSGIQPGVFDEQLYFLTTVLLLTSLVGGCAALIVSALRKLLKAGWPATIQLTSLLLFVMIQMTPAVDEAYYWFNGGIGYTFNYAVFALLIALSIHLWCCTSKKGAAWLTGGMSVLAILLGGGSYTGGLFGLLVFSCAVLLGFYRHSRWRWCFTGVWVLLAVGFLYSMTAPGNMVRAATLQGGMSAPMAIAQSFYFGIGLIGDWFSLPICVVCTTGVIALIPALAESRYRFRYPVLVTALCVCLYCSQLTPTLYTGNYLGDGRTVNTYYFTYVLMVAFLAIYWVGWSIKRAVARAAIEDKQHKGVRLGVVLAAAMILLAGFLSYHPNGSNDTGLINLASGSAVRSLITGEAAAYDKAMDERDTSMNDESVTEPVLQPVEDIPDAFMGDALENDNLDYVLRLYTEYYEKQRVTIAEGE